MLSIQFVRYQIPISTNRKSTDLVAAVDREYFVFVIWPNIQHVERVQAFVDEHVSEHPNGSVDAVGPVDCQEAIAVFSIKNTMK